MGVTVTQKRPPLWVNTDLASYLREQDGKDVKSMPAPTAETPVNRLKGLFNHPEELFN